MELREIDTDRLAFPAPTAGEGSIVLCWHGFPDHPARLGPLAEHLVAAGRDDLNADRITPAADDGCIAPEGFAGSEPDLALGSQVEITRLVLGWFSS